jgi:hypothetical protein
MRRRTLSLILVVSILAALAVPSAQAQESAIIQATATVLPSLTIIGTNNLQFGTVTPGVNKSVDKATLGFAGEWSIIGQALAEISLDFTLPDSLILVDSTVGMRIMFTNTDASYEDGTGAGQTAPAGTVNPLGPSALNLAFDGTLWIWIGGEVLPRLTQTGGDYAADVVLTVAYTGS